MLHSPSLYLQQTLITVLFSTFSLHTHGSLSVQLEQMGVKCWVPQGSILRPLLFLLYINTLSMHLGKTESILFGTKRKLAKSNTLKVMCNGSEIVSKSNVTYLGLTLDQSLSGESITEKVLDKCACKLKFLYRKAFRFFCK